MILASLIEKETSLPNERRIVASVFVNRLRKGMRLQTDPTVIYALTQGKGELGRPLYRKDLKFESPFNTYLNYGLPPEPICNPGIESIMAAAQPEVTDFLYFVAFLAFLLIGCRDFVCNRQNKKYQGEQKNFRENSIALESCGKFGGYCGDLFA